MKFLKMDPNFTFLYESSPISINITTDIESGEKTRASSIIPKANGDWMYAGQQRAVTYDLANISVFFSPIPSYSEQITPFLLNMSVDSNLPTTSIQGNLFYDFNQNCINDSGEEGIYYQPISANQYTTVTHRDSRYFSSFHYEKLRTGATFADYRWFRFSHLK